MRYIKRQPSCLESYSSIDFVVVGRMLEDRGYILINKCGQYMVRAIFGEKESAVRCWSSVKQYLGVSVKEIKWFS